MNQPLETIQSLIPDALRVNANLESTIQILQKQNDDLKRRMTTVYAGLEKFQLFTKDQKIPFQWIQPGNTGNTGGGSAKAHGTSTWTPGVNGTIIDTRPKPDYDTFDYYMVLPYPSVVPRRMRVTAGNWSALDTANWGKSQQMEGPVKEYIGDGFQYTCAWSANPRLGLRYWAGAQQWQPFKNVIVPMGEPVFWLANFYLDAARHVFYYDWLTLNGKKFDVGIEVPAVTARPDRKEYSIAVQLDGNKAGDAYTGLLNNLVAEWE